MRRGTARAGQTAAAVAALHLPEPVFRSCPWQPRALIEDGLRQWLRCAGAALADGQQIGMPSHAVDEAWHGLILCTALYARFCDAAYGRLLHHTPVGLGPPGEPLAVQLGRTVVAWSLVAELGEECVLWELDRRVGLEHPWGLSTAQIAAVERDLAAP